MLTPAGSLALYLQCGYFPPAPCAQPAPGRHISCCLLGARCWSKHDPLGHPQPPRPRSSTTSLLASLLTDQPLMLLLWPAALACRAVALGRDPSHAATFPARICWRSCPSVLLVCSRETRDVGVLQGSQLPPRSALCNLSCPGEAPCHGFYPSSLRCKARPGKSAQHFPRAHPSSTTGTGSASFSPFYHPRPPKKTTPSTSVLPRRGWQTGKARAVITGAHRSSLDSGHSSLGHAAG